MAVGAICIGTSGKKVDSAFSNIKKVENRAACPKRCCSQSFYKKTKFSNFEFDSKTLSMWSPRGLFSAQKQIFCKITTVKNPTPT